jgi:hypothetical protein
MIGTKRRRTSSASSVEDRPKEIVSRSSMSIKRAKSNDSGSKGRERSRQQEDLAAALKLTDDNSAFAKDEGGRSDPESDDGSEYSDGNGADEKAADRFRLLGFGEKGLDCPDDGNGEDLEWEDIENRLEDIDSLQDNGETSQGSGEGGNEGDEKARNTRTKIHLTQKNFFDEDTDAAANLIDHLEPNGHLAILSTLLRTLQKPNIFFDQQFLRYNRFLETLGPENVKASILRALEDDLLKLFDTSDVTLKTLRACNTSRARTYTWPGVYLHVIYDPHDVGVLGLYVGSSVKVAARIKIHEPMLEINTTSISSL